MTTLIWAVSALCIITQLRGFSYRVPESVNKVLFSGEVMPVSHLNQWRTYLPDAEFVNLYGPTEITCNCTYYRVEREFGADEKLPAGKPFPNEKVFLLDIGMYTSEKEPGEAVQKPEYREITQPGRIGEICVSGTAVGLGYYNDPVRTAEVFVQNPLNSSYEERIYRTGDLGFFNEEISASPGEKTFRSNIWGTALNWRRSNGLSEVMTVWTAYAASSMRKSDFSAGSSCTR